jgi:F-type H+-transporting ATPase subunit c
LEEGKTVFLLEELKMKKFGASLLLAIILVMALSAVALAADDATKTEAVKFYWITALAAGFGIAIAAFGTGMAQGNAIRGAVEGCARNPEASGKIQVMMLIGLALIESLCIYALVVALILIYANPGAGAVAKLLGMGG